MRWWSLRHAGLSRGAKALWLLLDQPSWTHRRVESLSFQPSGETRRRISWDFTVPGRFRIAAGPGRVAVPIATLNKGALKRLDVRDDSGAALSVWGREQNGELAAEVLTAGLTTLTELEIDDRAQAAIRDIVFARRRVDVEDQIEQLFAPLSAVNAEVHEDIEAVRALAETLADGFLLVVEVPDDLVDVRTVVKVSYDDDRLTTDDAILEAISGRASLTIVARGWGEARSWHLEVHAPDGLAVDRLQYEIWDNKTLDLISSGSEGGQASTAHLSGGPAPWGSDFEAEVRFAPTTPGLVNQVTVGAVFALALMLAGSLAADDIAERLLQPGRGGSLATLALSVPAFLLALLARGREHSLVSRVLVAPRMASFGAALGLWSAGLLLAWTSDADHIRVGFGLLAAWEAAMVIWCGAARSVGGDP